MYEVATKLYAGLRDRKRMSVTEVCTGGSPNLCLGAKLAETGQKESLDTKLADRTTSIEGRISRLASNTQATELNSANSPRDILSHTPVLTSFDAETLNKTRTDLSEAQRSRAFIQSRLQSVSHDLQQSRLQSALDKKRLNELATDKAALALRLKDRDDELKGKAKLLEDIHDETVSLTLQLNMAEEQALNLRKENKDLIQRWMARVGKEADAMNDASKFQ
ncbi:MAG: hypothetical protein Q9207_005217 [Kuettlingeria erythrocarpa]